VLQAVQVSLVPATCLAVEAALLHNFFWHERWTWRAAGATGRGRRFVRFHLANGAISLAGNAAVTAALVAIGAPGAVAVTGAVLICALLNFAAAHGVFGPHRLQPERAPHGLRIAERGVRNADRGLRHASCTFDSA
jgi:putative flippase GtrA